MNLKKVALVSGSTCALFAVVLGAFGAHALKEMLLASNRIDAYNTAVDYCFVHAIALLIVGIFDWKVQHQLLKYVVYCFILGILLFSGSLFLICIFDYTSIGFVTPIGGLFFVAAWLCLIITFVKTKV